MATHLFSAPPLFLSPTKVSPITVPRRSDTRHLSYILLKRLHERPICTWAIPNESQVKRWSSDGVTMVDPLEAKRLAAKQLQEIQAKERQKWLCRIEAINIAWAFIGLTAYLLIQGQTVENMLTRLAAYLDVITNFFKK